jgi:hypothetical protein
MSAKLFKKQPLHTLAHFSETFFGRIMVKTIETIRALKDGTRIMLCECSNLDEKLENVLREKSDFYVNCYNDSETQEACIHSNKKGYGEVLLIKYALSYIDKHNIKYKRMFKISGRY